MKADSKPVVVIGSLNMDLVVNTARLPARGETVFGNSFAYFPGGKGANQAVAAARLGARVFMVGAVGSDDFAEKLKQSLQDSRVDTTLVRNADTTTGIALISVDQSGDNTIVIVAGANGQCSPADADEALAGQSEPGILLIQHEVPLETVEYAIVAAKASGWQVILNPAPACPMRPELVKLCDVIIPNETEAAILTGLPVNNQDEAVQAARWLLAQGAGAAVVTLGSRGSICCTGEEVWHIPSYPIQVVDSTAAGDAYTGAMAAALAEGRTLRDSLIFATAAAAITVTREGAQPALAWREEVEEFMRKERG